jgi:hypothetical protein
MPKIVFYTVFAFAFVIGGAIFLLGIFPFRLFYLAPLSLLVIPFYGIRIGNVEKILLFFLTWIIISAIVNQSSPGQFFSFLRFIGIPYPIYYLCKNYIKAHNIKTVIRLCIIVACLQPPLVFLQQTFFDEINSLLPPAAHYAAEDKMDFSFGTFYASNDPALSFFLMGLIIFLLFDTKNNYFIKRRFLLAGYFTLGVLLSNSQLSNLLVILIWTFFIFRGVKVKALVKSLTIVTATVLLIISLGFYDFLKWKIDNVIEQFSIEAIQNASGGNFEKGNYERTAAIYYYLTQPLKLAGDGPSAYYDALNREFTLGNTGQVFTFYAEVGIMGLFIGYLILYSMGKRRDASPRMAWGCFLLISTLTITSFVLSDTSLILAYCIFLKTNLVSLYEHVEESQAEAGAVFSLNGR